MIYHHCFLNSALGNAIRSIQVNQDGMQLNGSHQHLVYTDDVNALSGSIHTIKKTH
jgi:outer membrane biogenesis lipoprotein LolB